MAETATTIITMAAITLTTGHHTINRVALRTISTDMARTTPAKAVEARADPELRGARRHPEPTAAPRLHPPRRVAPHLPPPTSPVHTFQVNPRAGRLRRPRAAAAPRINAHRVVTLNPKLL
mmetsp:Transcript_8878/g.20203  ORF Transcript_8878/g.20203 Transcript_8878/m.20203 type:complete len:121 (+) Transcript_8878:1879-2241(+)